ncbi:ATP-dependent DNA helicase MER3 [Paramyrothecium foliicola]|nr:ATP-dependent DNA helicase MER3 [Paramyrothecium foliicola]
MYLYFDLIWDLLSDGATRDFKHLCRSSGALASSDDDEGQRELQKPQTTLPPPQNQESTSTMTRSATPASLATPAGALQASSEKSTTPTLQSHDIQVRYKLANSTYKTLCTIEKAPTRREVLRIACLASEFRLFPVKQAEKAFFRHLNDHSAIPYRISETIAKPWHKVFLLVQANLLQDGWPNKISGPARRDLFRENGRIQVMLDKVLRCITDIFGERADGRGVSVALDVLRSVKARVWEGSGMDLRQLDGIGPAKMQKLADAGIKSIKSLSKLEFYHIERLLSRNPPFGQQMLHQLAGFPQLAVNFAVLGPHQPQSTPTSALHSATPSLASSSKQLWMARVLLSYLNEQPPAWKNRRPWVTLVIEGEDGRLLWFWRGSIKRLIDQKELLVAIQACKNESVQLTFACEEIVGTLKRETFKVE